MTLDRTDFNILAELQNDARLSNKELAARVDLAPSTCLERVRKLRAAGILGGAHAEVAPAALGIQLQAMVAVRLTRHSRDAFDHFLEHAFRLEEVVAVYHVAGPNDFLVHVAVRDTQHLREMVLDNFTTWPEVDHIETALIFDHRRKPALPDLRVAPEP